MEGVKTLALKLLTINTYLRRIRVGYTFWAGLLLGRPTAGRIYRASVWLIPRVGRGNARQCFVGDKQMGLQATDRIAVVT